MLGWNIFKNFGLTNLVDRCYGIFSRRLCFWRYFLIFFLRSYYCKMIYHLTYYLRPPYGVYLTKNRTIRRRPCGARAAPCRQKEESYAFCQILDIERCLMKFRYYLNFTALERGCVRLLRLRGQCPGTVRCPDGARPAFAHIGRAPDDFDIKCKRCPAGHRTCTMSEKRQELSKIYQQIGRCPAGHRTMFYESNCHRWETTCICRRTYWIYIH